MNQETLNALQPVLEQLNGLMYDIENWNDLSDMGEILQDCINRLEALGVNKWTTNSERTTRLAPIRAFPALLSIRTQPRLTLCCCGYPVSLLAL